MKVLFFLSIFRNNYYTCERDENLPNCKLDGIGGYIVKNWLHAILMISIILVGGCQVNNEDQTKKPSEMNPEELPDVRAFEDEFTRGFLQSTEETRPGYYPFLSRTRKYEMDFPAGGIVGQRGYSREKDRFESFIIGVAQNEIESSIDIKYMPDNQGEEIVALDMLTASFGRDLDFEKSELEGRNIYFSPFTLENGDFGYAAYIQNTINTGGLYIFYLSGCTTEEKCSEVKEEEQSAIMNWLNTIEFTNERE